MNEHPLWIGPREVLLFEGAAGWGECSPLPGYPCDPVAARRAAVEAAGDGFPPPVRDAVPVNALVEADTTMDEGLAERLVGFSCVKLKVRRDEPDRVVDRVAALRDLVGPRVALRVDANGAWDVETAADLLGRLARYDLELAEQPVASIADLAALRRRVGVPLGADESVRTVNEARALATTGAADVLVLKVQPVGGVRAGLMLAEEAGVPALVSSMLETSIGLSAGLALAAALPELHHACGLATLGAITDDIVTAPLAPRAGMLHVPDRWPVPDPELLARYSVRPAAEPGS